MFDQGAGAHDQGLVHARLLDPVEQITVGVIQNDLAVDRLQIPAGLRHQALQPGEVQRAGTAVGKGDIDPMLFRWRGSSLLGPFSGALFPVEHIVSGHLVLAGTHQGQFHLVLDVLDVHRAATGQAAGESVHHLVREGLHGVMDTAGDGRVAALDGQEGFGHGHHDLVGIEVGNFAIASDHPHLSGDVSGDLGPVVSRLGLGRCCDGIR